MKNILWFLYNPQDERERELYYRACARAFTFLMIALVIGTFIELRPIFLIITAFLVGWTTLRNEEMTHPTVFSSRLPPAKIVWGILGGVILMSMTASLLGRTLGIFDDHEFTYIVLGFSTIWSVMVRMLAWQSTDRLQLLARLLLVIFFPLFTIILARVKGESMGIKIMKTFGILLLLLIPLFIFTLIFVLRKLSPYPLS